MPPGRKFVGARPSRYRVISTVFRLTRLRITLCLVAGVRGCLMNVLYDERAALSTLFPKLVETQGAAVGLTDAPR